MVAVPAATIGSGCGPVPWSVLWPLLATKPPVDSSPQLRKHDFPPAKAAGATASWAVPAGAATPAVS
jgi:hypothetical protein